MSYFATYIFKSIFYSLKNYLNIIETTRDLGVTKGWFSYNRSHRFDRIDRLQPPRRSKATQAIGSDKVVSHIIFPTVLYELNAQSKIRHNSNHFAARFNMMAAFDERANLVAPYLLVIAVLRSRREKEARRKCRFWICEIFKKREEFGAYHTLVQELRLSDREFYFR